MDLTALNLTDLGVVVTALATVALFGVTAVLARETRRLANLTSQPQVVASIQANLWGGGFADLHVQNTGNATAFDIEVAFDPPLEVEDPVDAGDSTPFQKISLLKPGQALDSYIAPYPDIIDVTYTVTISWKRHPSNRSREVITHTIRVADVRGVSHLGSRDPVIQIAEDIRKIREDFHKIGTGWQKPKVDVFTSTDRRREREESLKRREEARKLQETQTSESSGGQ